MDTFWEYLTNITEPFVFEQLMVKAQIWLEQNLLVWATVLQLGAIAVAFVAAWLTAPALRRGIDHLAQLPRHERGLRHFIRALAPMALPLAWLLLQWLSVLVAAQAQWPHHLIQIAVSLLTAWVIIRLASQLVPDPMWSRSIAVVAWTVAALSIVGLFDATLALLDSIAFQLGNLRLSLLTIIKAGLWMGVLLWGAVVISRFCDRRVRTVSSFTPSVQLLLGKLVKIGLFTLAIVVALRSVGIDLTAFAVFSGAVGVGIGFGLQAVFSNFVAGLILLLEGSLKVGDFVDLESGVTGEVREINIRSTVITTNDNIDILVPNAEFMNGRVTNWTLRDAYRRYHVPFGVAYASDLELVRQAALEAAAEVEHTLHGNPRREPQVWLTGFGDSSLDFELVIWLTPEAGKRPAKVHADYCWALAHALRRHKIEIPFPQRDLHLKPPAELNVSLNGGGIRLAPGSRAETQPARA